MKNIEAIRNDFPILQRSINDNPLIYLDNAATSQKPRYVIDAISSFYYEHCANVQRGVYTLGEEATELYENARSTVARFLNADPTEIIFTRGCTESINFIATAWCDKYIRPGDEIIVSELEHHSNLIPWQQVAQRKKAVLRAIPVSHDGMLMLEQLDSLITKKTKIVAISQSSNAIGTQVDLNPIIERAHAVGSLVLVDAAQTAPRKHIDVRQIGCDFCTFSGHKMLGPTGIGVLYINKIVQDSLLPYQFGGGMVLEATMYESFWRNAPQRYEAGTPPIAQALGLKAAIDYLEKHINWTDLWKYEARLSALLIDGLDSLDGVKIVGPVEQLKKSGHLVSFVVDGIHSHDIAAFADKNGICVRAGTHCAQPLFKKLGLPGSVRISFYCYNTYEEVETVVQVVEKAIRTLKFK